MLIYESDKFVHQHDEIVSGNLRICKHFLKDWFYLPERKPLWIEIHDCEVANSVQIKCVLDQGYMMLLFGKEERYYVLYSAVSDVLMQLFRLQQGTLWARFMYEI